MLASLHILLPSSIENGRKVIRALDFLTSSSELNPAWFEVDPAQPDNIRVADELLVDLLFSANGQTFESLQMHVHQISEEGVPIVTLDVDGLLKTKTDYRDKDKIDIAVLTRLKRELG